MDRSNNTGVPLPQPTSDERVMREDLDIFGYCLIENAIKSDELSYLQDRLIEQAEIERKIHNLSLIHI